MTHLSGHKKWDGKIAQWVKFFMHKIKTCVLFPRIHMIKAMPATTVLRGRARMIPEAHCLVSLVKMVSSRFWERPCPYKNKIESDRRHDVMLPTGLSMPMWSSEPSQTLVLICACNMHCTGRGEEVCNRYYSRKNFV